MRKTVRIVALLASALIADPGTAYAQDCFFSGVNAQPPSGCSPDPYNIAAEPEIVRALNGLGFAADEIKFRGCAVGRFSVSRPGSRSYTISYPLSERYTYEAYLGPIAHELGHAAQIKEAGSMDGARQMVGEDSSRLELGADFLAGFIFRRLMEHLDQQSFEESLDLLGSYEPGPLATHSLPEARTAAFRMGFNYLKQPTTHSQAHSDFQRNRFGGIIREMLP